jgi:branched-chain amino acid transport system ATP-binding protein
MSQNEKYLELVKVNKSFGGLRAMNNVSFSIKKHRITSLIGPNGAGKTTTFNAIAGLLKPDSGKVLYKGRDITGFAPHELVKLGIARTFQDLKLFNKLTAVDNVLIGMQRRYGETLWQAVVGALLINERTKKDIEKAKAILASIGLSHQTELLAENMSYGDQKLLALARVMASDAELVMLDEPASGLPAGRVDEFLKAVKRLVEQKGKTALVIEHNMEAVMEISDWIVVLSFGQVIASGTPKEIQENEEVIKVYLGS